MLRVFTRLRSLIFDALTRSSATLFPRICLTCFFLLGHGGHAAEIQTSYITYGFSGGRFGDNLLSYLHAKWVSYCSGIPLLYKPFPYSSFLELHDHEPMDSNVNLPKHIRLDLSTHPKMHPELHLYTCPYFSESPWERGVIGDRKESFYFNVDWEDPEFRKIAIKMISPKDNYSLTIPPEGKISVALHVRNGGGFDITDGGVRNPTKFPPIDFYITTLQRVVSSFEGMEIYCFVFTDARDPASIIEQIKHRLPSGNLITFECRSRDNFHDQNVLQDFFSLFHFDILIHAESNFSLIPSLLHDYAITCHPILGHNVGSTLIIDQVFYKTNETLCEKLREKRI